MIYVGKHSTRNLEDGYLGSGKRLSYAISRYGRENFERHVLISFDSSKEASEFEAELVDESFVHDQNTYNLTVGGGDGWWCINNLDEVSRKEKNRRAALAMNEKCWADPEFRARQSERARLNLENLRSEGRIKAPDWTGKKHSESSKKKIGDANRVCQTGSGNSQFGTMWIHNMDQKISKKISKQEIEKWIDVGWQPGRRIKW